MVYKISSQGYPRSLVITLDVISCAAAGLWHFYVLSWTNKKILKKLYEKKLLQFTIFSRKKTIKIILEKKLKK
jgi:hypothetical protein